MPITFLVKKTPEPESKFTLNPTEFVWYKGGSGSISSEPSCIPEEECYEHFADVIAEGFDTYNDSDYFITNFTAANQGVAFKLEPANWPSGSHDVQMRVRFRAKVKGATFPEWETLRVKIGSGYSIDGGGWFIFDEQLYNQSIFGIDASDVFASYEFAWSGTLNLTKEQLDDLYVLFTNESDSNSGVDISVLEVNLQEVV
jgi:hypothetical protein